MKGISDPMWNTLLEAASAAGSHFFSEGAMRFFKSRLEGTPVQAAGRIYFITSEKFVSSRGEALARRYTLRSWDLDEGRIVDCSEFQQFASRKAAQSAQQKCAMLALQVGKPSREALREACDGRIRVV